jgi:hypothetical protein
MGEDEDKDNPKLDWKDFVAIGIAMLETVLLPIVIVLVLMIALLAVLVH